MFAWSDASHGIVLDGLACLAQQFVRGVFLVGVEVDDVGYGRGLGGMRFAGVVVAAEELAFGGCGEVQVGGYGV